MNTNPRKGRRIRLTMASVVAAGALIIGPALPAAAATYNVSAELNCSGALFQSGTYRPHSSGPSTIRLTKNDWWKSTWFLRTGLRVGTTQTTQTLQFAPTSRQTYNYRLSNGSTTLPTGSYAMNARVETSGNGGCVLFPPTFEGTLVL